MSNFFLLPQVPYHSPSLTFVEVANGVTSVLTVFVIVEVETVCFSLSPPSPPHLFSFSYIFCCYILSSIWISPCVSSYRSWTHVFLMHPFWPHPKHFDTLPWTATFILVSSGRMTNSDMLPISVGVVWTVALMPRPHQFWVLLSSNSNSVTSFMLAKATPRNHIGLIFCSNLYIIIFVVLLQRSDGKRANPLVCRMVAESVLLWLSTTNSAVTSSKLFRA